MTNPETATRRGELANQYVAHRPPSDGGEGDPWFRVHIGPLTIRLPNPSVSQRAVFFHDTSHVLTGYDTVLSDGEMFIAGFEVESGCGPYWIAWFINLNMFALGLLLCPRPMFQCICTGQEKPEHVPTARRSIHALDNDAGRLACFDQTCSERSLPLASQIV